MGLISAGLNALGGTLSSQWREYMYADALPERVLAVKAMKKTRGRFGGSRTEDDNVISEGSVIAVNEGQCMIVVDQGRIVDFCAQAGEYTYTQGGEPTILYGSFDGEKAKALLKETFERFSFGGQAGKDQRVYFFNTKEITGNRYGTPNPVPFRVVDANIGLDIDVSIRCFGEYSYRITDPMLFYTHVCGNVEGEYTTDQLENQLRTELLTALQPAFARISERGVRYSALPGHTQELASELNDILSAKWAKLRGIEIVSFGVSSVTANAEDEAMIKQLQRAAVMRNPNMAAAQLVDAQAQAMKDAANNAAGAFTGFMGMNMAGQAGGMNAQSLFAMGQQQEAARQAAPSAPKQEVQEGWLCSCGARAKGRFCPECGAKKPEAKAQEGWTCSCGAVNTGKFCPECGSRRPVGAPVYRCDKCGWKPEDPAHPPKFCPECGDRFDEADRV